MTTAIEHPFDALLWIIFPDNVLENESLATKWLEKNVEAWTNLLRNSVNETLPIKIIAFKADLVPIEKKAQGNISAAIASVLHVTDISFKHDSCLRNSDNDSEESQLCDLFEGARSHQAHRLLLIDEQGRGYPCFGAWKAVQDGEIDIPEQETFRDAYRKGNIRSLCEECMYGESFGKWDIFPCSRYGCHALESIWGGSTKFPHLQIGYQNFTWCRNFKPNFEISLDQSRVRLERLLFDDEFWRYAFIEKKLPLDFFWPADKDTTNNIIPLSLSGEERYTYTNDTPTSLDNFPALNYFPHHPHRLDTEDLSDLRKRFLPLCFLPHLRVLFEMTKQIFLLSVILTDPFSNSEFNYRSLYRDGVNQPDCFDNDKWKILWRLPNNSPQWKNIILNLSSAIRNKNDPQGKSRQEPQEYIVTLIRNSLRQRSYRKTEINLAEIWERDFGNLRDRANTLRRKVQKYSERTESLYEDLFFEVFLSEANTSDRDEGKKVWGVVKELPSSNYFYLPDNKNGWVPSFEKGISDEKKASFGCRLLNYLIWIRAIFGDNICAIETFNSTNISRSKPSQFVTFSSAPLDPASRARLKLTLTTLLQPIEGAYAIHTEMASEKAQFDLRMKDTEITAKKGAIRHYGHTMGHRISPVVAYFEGHDPTNEAAACARLVRDMTIILQAYAVNNQSDFFHLNYEKNGRFVNYDKPLNLINLLESEIQQISAKEVQMSHGIVYRYPKFDINANKASITLALKDPLTNRPCRLNTAFFTQLLSELVINAVQHAWHNRHDEDIDGKRAGVTIGVDTMYLHGEPALILANYYSEDAKRAPDFFSPKWQLWPKDRENDGPGMALSVFQSLDAGKMMIKVIPPIPEQNEPGQVYIALLLNGLIIE